MKGQVTELKDRKHGQLWQYYQVYSELTQMISKHKNRISAVERNVSHYDIAFEKDIIRWLEMLRKGTGAKKLGYSGFGQVYLMEQYVESHADIAGIYHWTKSIKGIDSAFACGLIAQVDDIAPFTNVSKLWRYAGQAVIEGHSERKVSGEVSHYNNDLKAIVFLIGKSFVMAQTPVYVEIYYEAKDRYRAEHPEPVVRLDKNGKPARNKDGQIIKDYTPLHIDMMAMRKARKIFLQHFWLKWRTYSGLPTNDPYVKAILGHSDII